MEVPSAVLEKLVCERCGGHLSRGPVHLLENTKYRCGRCPWTADDGEEEGIRVEAYEELAQLMTFPCRYKENGCTSQVPFLDNKQHEEACPYREYLCPVTESGQCHWTGLQNEVLGHCQQDHPTKVLPENPCKFTYDITQPSLNNYVLFVFEMLFLIQSKVCTASRKIYHAVRLIDDPARASDFKFTLEMKNNNRLFSIHGDVLPRQLLTLQEDTSVATGINSLLEMLGDFNDTTFTVTVESSGQGTSWPTTVAQVRPPVKTLEVTVRCRECDTTTELVYRGDWLCKRHAPKQRTCKNKTRGCTYSDLNMKCVRHEYYYCQYSTWCLICSNDITGTTLDSHYFLVHGDLTHGVDTVCPVSPLIWNSNLMINCDFGRAVCKYRLNDSYLVLWLFTPLASAQLYKYRCTVDFSHPDTAHTLKRTPAVLYSNLADWYVSVPLSDYNTYVHDQKVNMKINITKIDDLSQFIV